MPAAPTVTSGGGVGHSSGTIAPTIPASVAGDLLLAFIGWDSSTTLTVPSGWTNLVIGNSDSSTGKITVYSAPGGSTPGNTWTMTGGSFNHGWGVVVNVHSGSGFTVAQDGGTTSSGFKTQTTVTAPGPTTVAANDVTFVYTSGWASPGQALSSWPSGYTDLYHVLQSGSAMGVAYAIDASNGAQPSVPVTFAGSVNANVITASFQTQIVPPTVNAGANQTVAALGAATLTGTITWASGHSGTVAWTAITGGAPAITAGASTTTATIGNTGGPITPTADTYQLAATQDDGQVTTATTVVTVDPAPQFQALGGTWVPMYPMKRAHAGAWV